MLAFSGVDAVVAFAGVVAMIVVPYWLLYWLFRKDSPEPRDDGT